jgi:cystathionine beta-lyase/cystathionine gamma-synthase
MIEPSIYTLVVHAGTKPDPSTGAIMTPIYQTTTYQQSEPGVHKGYDYSRAGNPTRKAYEEALALLEGAECGLAFSSGVAAEQAVVQLLEPGTRVLVCNDVYGGTKRLFQGLFARYQLEFSYVDMTDVDAVRDAATGNTGLLWMESPTNPTLRIVDIQAMAEIARDCGALLAVDNTFATPVFQSPLKLGADIVTHSTSKYIGGHSDIVGGAIMTSSEEIYDKLKFIQFAAGSIPSPFECFMLLRSIKTLAVRMVRHERNALAVAEYLSSHTRVERVYYPGLVSDPGHELARRQMSGFGGVVSFQLAGTRDDVLAFFGKLKIFALAESLGGVESLAGYPAIMSHESVPRDQLQALGITPNLIRLAPGIESSRDLIADLKQALEP